MSEPELQFPVEVETLTEQKLSDYTPSWLHPAYWALVGLGAAFLLLSFVVRINEYSEGPALITAVDRTDVTAQTAGVVDAITVQPGQRVGAGELLARFSLPTELAELDSVQQELDDDLTQFLSNPGDPAARQTVAAVKVRRDLAAAKVSLREIRAPAAGLVGDVRIRPGQRLAAGDLVLTLLPFERDFTVLALLPARDRAQLKLGLPLQLELDGFPFIRHTLTLDSRTDLSVGPAEARRFLGPRVADALPLEEPVVIVQARLRRDTFSAFGRLYPLYDGLRGQVRVQVRSSRLISVFVPALKTLEETRQPTAPGAPALR